MKAASQKPRSAAGSGRIYLICLVHLVLCITIIATCTPGNRDLKLGGVLISPTLQWANTAFNCACVVSIILAAVGTLYLIESHLDIYFAFMIVSILVDIAWFFVFFIYGEECQVSHADAQHLVSSVSCGLNSGVMIILITIFVLFKIFALWAITYAKRSIRIKYTDDLLPYLRKNLTQSLGTPSPDGSTMVPTASGYQSGRMGQSFQGADPAYGSVASKPQYGSAPAQLNARQGSLAPGVSYAASSPGRL